MHTAFTADAERGKVGQDRSSDGNDATAGGAADVTPAAVRPEDDVTSEIVGLVDLVFDETGSHPADDIRVNAAHLVAGASATDAALPPGTVLNDRYELLELVHSGGMGQVYKAADIGAGDTGAHFVAIKISRPGMSGSLDPDAVLRHEAAIAKTLKHPNIIRIEGCAEHADQHYLVMEWLEGESVNALLKRKSGQRVAPEMAWRLIEGAAAALEHVHARGIVHADINPSNLFITADGGIRLLDFGVARACDERLERSEADSAWVTQTYASPEILAGLNPVFEDDVFALACVAYRLLSGKHPFGGATSILAKHRGLSVDVPPGLAESEWRLLERSLAYTRAERPASVADFLAVARERRSHASDSRQNYWPLLAAAAAIAAVALAGGWWYTAGREASIVPDSAPAGISEPLSETAAPESGVDRIGERLAEAEEAVFDGRLVAPAGDSARDRYREVLAIDPQNAVALRGLRGISDDFVRQADTALRGDDPESAAAALVVAAETDPGNPAIDIVGALLAERGERELAEARSAVNAGDVERAIPLLDRAARYPGVQEATVEDLRVEIAALETERRFARGLDSIDEHLSAGRLLQPGEDNAMAAINALESDFGDEPRLRARRERLGERVLSRAAFLASSGETEAAGGLLDAVSALGVLENEVSAARAALVESRIAVTEIETETATDTMTEPEIEAVVAEPFAGIEVTQTPRSEPLLAQSRPAIDASPAASARQDDRADTAAPAAAPVVMRLEDLGLERFVPPEYPRAARRRNVTGVVAVEFDVNRDGSTGAIEVIQAEPEEIFDESAVDAVRQWRFAPRGEVVRGRVSLRFAVE